MGRAFFTDATDAIVGFLPPTLRGFSTRRGSRTLKVWFSPDGREHYEIQFVSKHGLRAAERSESPPVLEIGFHAEHPDEGRNEEAVASLLEREDEWRTALGPRAEAGPFIGPQRTWRRLSELWTGDAVTNPEASVEAAERLAAYIRALEPVRGGP